MAISFEKIKLGGEYSRQFLAATWGYSGFQAIARGVVTPRDDNKIILFVTEEKQSTQEQYKDTLKGDLLFWEGPNDHFAEDRMTNLQNNDDTIHIFYRNRHHSDFIYLGIAKVLDMERNTIDPSRFTFRIGLENQAESAS